MKYKTGFFYDKKEEVSYDFNRRAVPKSKR